MAKDLLVIAPPPGPHVPTRRTRILVAKLVSFGLTEPQIAVAAGIQPLHLRKHYRDELEHGTAIVTAKMGSALVRQGLKGDTNAIALYLKARAHWVVPTKMEVTGKDGGPVEIERRSKLIGSILERMRRLEAAKQEPPLTQQQKDAPGGKPGAVH